MFNYEIKYGDRVDVSIDGYSVYVKEEPLSMFTVFTVENKVIDSLPDESSAILYAMLYLDKKYFSDKRISIIRESLMHKTDILYALLDDLDYKFFSIFERSYEKISLIINNRSLDVVFRNKTLKSETSLKKGYCAVYEYAYKLSIYHMIKSIFGKETIDLADWYVTA